MNQYQACRVLGLTNRIEEISESDLKKRYRELMLLVHPDSGTENAYYYDAREINEAYDYLKKWMSTTEGKTDSQVGTTGKHTSGRYESGNHTSGKPGTNAYGTKVHGSRAYSTGTYSTGAYGPGGYGPGTYAYGNYYGDDADHFRRKAPVHHWNAPLNENAYTERPVYHEVEDEEWNVIGTIEIDRNKFYWTEEENFKLFLMSLYSVSRELLGDCEHLTKEKFRHYQGELSFLLAKQYIDQQAALARLADHIEDSSGKPRIYSVSAMLELNRHAAESLRAAVQLQKKQTETFYPSALRHHRLYLKDSEGLELGYLSFTDDRLYYIIIPLFEDRRVQVRITGNAEPTHTRTGKDYTEITLEMRFLPPDKELPENINMQIENLIRKAHTFS